MRLSSRVSRLKWAVTKKFRSIDEVGCHRWKFHVITNSNRLTYLFTSAKLSITGHPWLSNLSTYDFTITYRVGKFCGDADGLSRMPQERETDQLQNDRTSDSDYLKPFVEKLYPSETDPVSVCTMNEVEAICGYHIANNSDVRKENTCPVVAILGLQATALDSISGESNVCHPETGLGLV